MIPIFRPAISDEEIAAVASVFRSGWLGPGPRVAELEAAFARAVGAPYAISVSSGTAALTATLAGLGVGPGDEIILPAFTFISAFRVLTRLGAAPVFADVEPEHLTLDAQDVARRITPRTRGILTVHHGGQLSDMNALADVAHAAGIWLIDDAAHAVGASYRGRPVGSLCRATCFSFGAVKNLTTGDGGMVTTPDTELAQRISAYRSLGLDKDTWARYGNGAQEQRNRWAYHACGSGERSHMNDIVAAIGIVQLRRLPELNAARAERVARYEEAFADVAAFRSVKPREHTTPSWHMYTILMENRDAFVDGMQARGITVGVHYYPIHLYPICRAYRTELPVTEEVWQKVTTFPLYPTMTAEEQARVICAARQLSSAAE